MRYKTKRILCIALCEILLAVAVCWGAVLIARPSAAELPPVIDRSQVIEAGREMLVQYHDMLRSYLVYQNCREQWQLEIGAFYKGEANKVAMQYNAYMLHYSHLLEGNRPPDMPAGLEYIL